MPPIYRFACNECDFALPRGGGSFLAGTLAGTLAVTLEDGRRELLPHPVEFGTAHRLTGKSFDVLQAEGGIGSVTRCLCLSCLALADLDRERDRIVCPHCGRTDLKPVRELAGETCPQCGHGTIERRMIGFS